MSNPVHVGFYAQTLDAFVFDIIPTFNTPWACNENTDQKQIIFMFLLRKCL